jgi:hypothetical protein
MAEVFDSASDRIAFSEAVDFIEQGSPELIPQDLAEAYVRHGLLVREGGSLRLTEEGKRQRDIGSADRSSAS